MTLTNDQALDVVIGCVKKVGGRLIGPADSLSSGGIVDQPRLTSLQSQIVANQTLGVAKFEHRLPPAVLGNLGTGDSVQDAADVVRDNAVPAAAAAAAMPMGFADGSSGKTRAIGQPKQPAAAKSSARPTRKRTVKKATAGKQRAKTAKRPKRRPRKSSRRGRK